VDITSNQRNTGGFLRFWKKEVILEKELLGYIQ
jgi:hypothetical protein